MTSHTPSQPMTTHTPTPWRASKCGYLMGSDGVGLSGEPREVQVGQIGDFFDKELLPFNRDRWQADLELIVECVNSHASLKARIEELETKLGGILKANDDFRAGMPEKWDGDPLQDACDDARAILQSKGNSDHEHEEYGGIDP